MDQIANFIFKVHQFALPGFYDLDGKEIDWSELPDDDKNNEAISKSFYIQIANYLKETYLNHFDRRPPDEVIETLAIFFSKIHASTLPVIFNSIEISRLAYSNSLKSKEWNGNNWEYLPEVIEGGDAVDKRFFRNIARHFIDSCLRDELNQKQN